MPVVRSASLAGLGTLIRDLGGDPATFLKSAHLPADTLRRDDLLIPMDGSATLLEDVARKLACPDLGLRLGVNQQMDGLGPLAVAMRHSAHMRDAMECAKRFMTLQNQGSTIQLEEDPYESRGVVGLRFVWHYEGGHYIQSMDKFLANAHQMITILAGGNYGLRSVELSYRPTADLARYRDVFGDVRINTQQSLTMLRIPGSLLNEPISGAEAMLRDIAMHWLDSRPLPTSLVTTDSVRSALEALLGTGRISIEWVARHLELSARTLQRRLSSEGSTYATILDEVRRERAEELMAETTLTLADITAMLDLVDQSSLSRAAQRWWETTARERLRAVRAG